MAILTTLFGFNLHAYSALQTILKRHRLEMLLHCQCKKSIMKECTVACPSLTLHPELSPKYALFYDSFLQMQLFHRSSGHPVIRFGPWAIRLVQTIFMDRKRCVPRMRNTTRYNLTECYQGIYKTMPKWDTKILSRRVHRHLIGPLGAPWCTGWMHKD